MKREQAREWTLRLYCKHLPDEPDAYTTFLHLVDAYCPEQGRIADLGCGEEEYLTCLLDKAGEIVGVDDRSLSGSYRRYLRTDLNREIPLQDGSVDVAASKFLLEHLEDPARFYAEVGRILRPGGLAVLMTPNILYYPYCVNYLMSKLMPQRCRMRLVQLFSGRPPDDIFPVHYRSNTPRRMRRELAQAGLEIVHMRTYSDCLVSAVTRPLGVMAVAYEKVVDILGLGGARGFIVVAARKR